MPVLTARVADLITALKTSLTPAQLALVLDLVRAFAEADRVTPPTEE